MRWEYHTLRIEAPSETELRTHLNVLGAAGWELAACYNESIAGVVLTGRSEVRRTGDLILMLKRPL